MKILFITDFFYPHIGGVEKLFTSLAARLVEKGNEVTYITWRHDKRLQKEELFSGISIIRISSPTRMLFPFIALPKLIKEARKSDLIHTSTYSSAIGAWIAARLTGKKVIVTVHEVWGNLWKQLPFLTKFEKTVFKLLETTMLRLKFDRYIAVSNSTREALIQLNIAAEKVKMIYNGIENNLPTWGKPEGQFTFTFFGRAGVSKGIDILIDAATKISEYFTEVKFKFIVSPQHTKVSRFIQEATSSGVLSKSATLFSDLSKKDLLNELLSSHCIIIPSICEGFGFTAAEASAMSIPIISSGKGSLPEVVSGKVIEMKEYSSTGLFEAMKAALNNEFIDVNKKEFKVDAFVLNHLEMYKS